LLARAGVEVAVAGSLRVLRDGIGDLLALGQRSGVVRPDARTDEVMALLTSTCQGALLAGWDDDLQRRTLAVIFDGLRSAPRAAGAP
jgi:hypothetical protein